MKQFFLFVLVAVTLTASQNANSAIATSFKTPTTDAYTAAAALPVTTVSGYITSNTTWDNSRVWEIDGVIRVTGGTLTIEAGTYIKAKPGTVGALVICKGGKINAIGTACNPIVFTSYNLLDGNAATNALPGDFGGVVILGDAPVNTGVTTNVIEGLTDQSNFSSFYYGGTNGTHNGGTLQYVRIEFAGRILSSGNELNGLTLGGVGNGTIIDHIQVSYAVDDAFEFFGGTVNASYLVAFACKDDAFDFEIGYTGSIARAIAISNKNSDHSIDGSGNADSNGIEITSNLSNTPITRPIINYMSVYGVSACADQIYYEKGIDVKDNGHLIIRNSVVSGYGTGVYCNTNSIITSVNDKIYAFTNAALGNGIFGTGFTNSIGCSAAANFGLNQPFYTPGSCVLDFTSGTTTAGAFADGIGDWTACWTKFCGFQTIYE